MTAGSPAPSADHTQREAIAMACRVLAHRGLAEGILGHISLRITDTELLVRCRGPQERGLAYTEASDIHFVDLDGNPAGEGELDGGYTVPNELPLHTELLRRHPQIRAVVHAHPPKVVAADLAGLAVRPIVGAYDIPGTRLAAGGVPVYPRGVLVRNRQLAAEMAESMGNRPVVILRGHGITSAAGTVEQAVLQAISVDSLAGLALQIAAAGGELLDLPEADMAELPDLGGSFNTLTAWRHELARLG
ncbi:class II aldolase/adducin family protein [Arthrobacter crystallopoietes]|uniref:class II aldolase/adducin family protein n=1 Tax=Crystallibacter crystallopoietes TaxID=37928 RepID=UPI003D1B3ADA